MSVVRGEADEAIDALLDESVAVAWVVLGDEDAAREAAAHVVLEVHDEWARWREDRPVARVREAVVAHALASAGRRTRDVAGPASALATDDLSLDSNPPQILQAALSDVSASGRAVLAATILQDASPAEACAWVQARAALPEPLDGVVARVAAAMTAARCYGEVDAFVRAAAFEVSSAGVRERAAELRRARVRRRLVVGAGVAAVALAGTGLVWRRAATSPALGVPSPSSPSPIVSGEVAQVLALPPAADLQGLPDLPHAVENIAIPRTWGLSDLSQAARLSDLGTAGGSIRALFVYEADGQPVPVAYLPRHDPPFVVLDGVLPGPPGIAQPLWSTRLIDDDRRRVALVTRGRLTVVELGTGTVRPVELASLTGAMGGWTMGSRWFNAHTETEWVRIDPDSGGAQPIGPQAYYARRRIQAWQGTLFVEDFDAGGELYSRRGVPGTVGSLAFGDTITSLDGWAASVGTPVAGPGVQGVYAVSWDVSARAKLLYPAVARPEDLTLAQVLGWAPGDVLLVLIVSALGMQVIGWNLVDDSLSMVVRRFVVPPGATLSSPPSLSP